MENWEATDLSIECTACGASAPLEKSGCRLRIGQHACSASSVEHGGRLPLDVLCAEAKKWGVNELVIDHSYAADISGGERGSTLYTYPDRKAQVAEHVRGCIGRVRVRTAAWREATPEDLRQAVESGSKHEHRDHYDSYGWLEKGAIC